jgi:MFS family permease
MIADAVLSPPRPRNRTPLLAMFAGNAISLVGNAVTNLAIPWFVLETTGSAARTGVTAFASMLPTVVGGLFGGVLVDRLGRKRVSILADLASGASVASIPLLYHTVGLAFWQLLVLVFLGALLDSPGSTARQALTPELADMARMPLERANAAFQTIGSLSLVAGPTIAGLLIATLGPSDVLWVDAASFLVSAAMVGAFVPDSRTREAEQAAAPFPENVTAGLRFIWHDAFLRGLLLPAMLLNFLSAPLFSVLMPVFARQRYGEAVDFGLLVAGFGVGSVAGSVAYGAIGPRLSKRWALAISFLVFGLPIFGLVPAPPVPLAVGLLALAGMLGSPINVIAMTALQSRTPAPMLGRVIGAVVAMATALAPLGMLTAGVVVEAIGVSWALLAVALGTTLTGVAIARNPVLTVLDREVTALT